MGQDGSSPVTAVFGLVVFLAFLMLSSQALVHLYATSVVTAVAFDTARDTAAEGRGCGAAGPDGRLEAAAFARVRLGRIGESSEVTVRCWDDGDTTTIALAVPSPARAFGGVLSGGGLTIERSASVRTERIR